MIGELVVDEFGDCLPVATGESGGHPWHVDRGCVSEGELANSLKAFADGFVADWRWMIEAPIRNAGLANDVRDAEPGGDADELDVTEGERERFETCRPAAIGALGFGPAV
jgi:hypothetical protein